MHHVLPHRARSLLLLLLLATALPWVGAVPVAQAAGPSIKVNFQSAEAPVPSGYLRDSGDAFALRSGANQGGGTYSYGWVTAGTTNPLILTNQGRDRGQDKAGGIDQRLDTLMHMQPTGVEGAWEIGVTAGTYDVIVGIGDALMGTSPERHVVHIEGTTAITGFVPSGANGSFTRHRRGWAKVTVTDGRLTVDARGGLNTKINYIDIQRVDAGDLERPGVTGVTPTTGAVDVMRDTGILATVAAPNGGIIYTTVNTNTVRLMRLSDGARVPFFFNSSAGGDVISIQPADPLESDTQYLFEVTDDVKDDKGVGFKPFYSVFTTGVLGGPVTEGPIKFSKVRGVGLPDAGSQFSSLSIGPDGKLYAASLHGEIYRWTINDDGTLSSRQVITTVRSNEGGVKRAIIGLAWDPAATANNLILWVSHNGPYLEKEAEDWTGKIARLSGNNLQNFQNKVVGLPHSFKDHMNNSLIFGPGGKLYLASGSNSAMGVSDDAWGLRPERLLSASILQIDTALLPNSPLDVKTEEGGSYDPYAPGAPVTIYASGVRNAYDLVMHTNGRMYAPTNGSAAGGNTPAIPAPELLPQPACSRRGYNGPTNKPEYALVGPDSQKDWLFNIQQGGYYGHPNPLRCEWVMNGGNPTNNSDWAEVAGTVPYPVGTQPDPNWRPPVHDFGLNKSPNGSTEYRNDAFKGELKGALLVTRFSQGKDVVALKFKSDGSVDSFKEKIPGLTSFNNPLDVVENRQTGDLYVIEFGPPSSITLVRPLAGEVADIELSTSRIIASDVVDSTDGPSQTVTIRNIGNSTLLLSSIEFVGADAGQFKILGIKPTEVPANQSRTIQVAMRATSTGVKVATLEVRSNARSTKVSQISMRGLGIQGTGGADEPSLQRILDTYQIAVNVGDPNPNDSSLPPTGLLGDEVALPQFDRADSQTPVTIEPLAVFGPTNASPVVRFGWYRTDTLSQTELFRVGNVPSTNGQRLSPVLIGGSSLTFDPGRSRFSFYSGWPAFGDRVVYGEDERNTWEPIAANRHKMRVYPLKDAAGKVVENAYVVAFEEHTEGYDYQDVVVVVRNVKAPPPPTAPIVSAGSDQTVFAGATVSLQGLASDANDDPLTVSWRLLEGPSVAFRDPTSLTTTFVAQQAGVYLLELTALDTTGRSSSDTVIVTALAREPSVQAGADQTVGKGATVTLSGTGSVPSGETLTYRWEQIDGPPVTLQDADTPTARFAAEQEGTYTFRLTVVNAAASAQAADEVQVVVNADAPPPPPPPPPDKTTVYLPMLTMGGP